MQIPRAAQLILRSTIYIHFTCDVPRIPERISILCPHHFHMCILVMCFACDISPIEIEFSHRFHIISTCERGSCVIFPLMWMFSTLLPPIFHLCTLFMCFTCDYRKYKNGFHHQFHIISTCAFRWFLADPWRPNCH